MNNKTKKLTNAKADNSNEPKYLPFRSYKPKYIKSEVASLFKDRKTPLTDNSTITDQKVKPEKSATNTKRSSSKTTVKKLEYAEKLPKEANAKPKAISQLVNTEHFPKIFATSDLIEGMKKANITADTESTKSSLTNDCDSNLMIFDGEAKKDAANSAVKPLPEDGRKSVDVAKSSDSAKSVSEGNYKNDSSTPAENERTEIQPYLVEIQQLKQMNASLMDMQTITLNKLIQLKDIIRERNTTINSLEKDKQFEVRKSYEYEKEIAYLREIIRKLVNPKRRLAANHSNDESQTEPKQEEHKSPEHDKEITNFKTSIFQAFHNCTLM